ncbi:MAG: DMT family transporter [Pseudomonadota bacterium]
MPSEPTPLIIAIAILLMMIGGMSISIQAPINATLNRFLDDPVLTACVSFFVGFVALLIIWLAGVVSSGRGFALPDLAEAPSWVWIGGLLGTTYVLAALWSVPRVGVVTLVAAAVLGQLLAALVIDATGAFGLEARAVSPTRIMAVVLVLGGLLLSRV